MSSISVELPEEVVADLDKYTQLNGVTRNDAVAEALKGLLRQKLPFEPRNDWERKLMSIGTDCSISLPDEALSSEGIY